MNWTEVNIFTTTEGIDPVCGCLLCIGITGFVIKDAKDFEDFLADKTGNWDYIDDDLMNLKNCETCVTVYLPENSQGADMLSSIRSEMVALAGRDSEKKFGRLAVELANVREEDWANNWKQYFKPLRIGDKLLIKPSWENCDENEARVILEIDPESSFGTGQHHTTQLCLEQLERIISEGDRVLDLGCGSGILSIAALLLGASEATAVDIDANSVKIAAGNAEKNHIPKEKYTCFCGNVAGDEELCEKIGSGFDIITANIVADVLIAMSGVFGKFIRPGGKLILSGIISQRSEEVLDAMKNNGYILETVAEKEDWVACTFTRPKMKGEAE